MFGLKFSDLWVNLSFICFSFICFICDLYVIKGLHSIGYQVLINDFQITNYMGG